ncbi:hypothetical protein M1B78_06025 [Bacteroides sp. KH569_7]|uniref:Uncharacterized protein n=1 Tax=Bacteroides muris (ex Fokt et al. 2023) TaxID=2937417 RepID=A0A9X2NWY9_9BACE|nr:hypothetical protein [Bacteroides muris (ex Fokt et al. 2023)]MCR6507743.1 hypothetical protein [Bacteroides muris (ex Fokt et al. 2023)]
MRTKENIKAALLGLLRQRFQLKGRNSLRSNSLPFFTLKSLPPLDAPRPCGWDANAHTAQLSGIGVGA